MYFHIWSIVYFCVILALGSLNQSVICDIVSSLCLPLWLVRNRKIFKDKVESLEVVLRISSLQMLDELHITKKNKKEQIKLRHFCVRCS